MDSTSLSPKLDSQVPKKLGRESQASKKRKVEKTVVTVRIETTNVGKQKNEGPPSDFWSWRKYGQKPIKGSPYPRGYYRCSTSKGCSAKKQVERSKTDASVLIVTYTSSHNHPGPDIPTTNNLTKPPLKDPQEMKSTQDDDHDHDLPPSPKQEQEQEQEQDHDHEEQEKHEESFNYILQSPIRCSQGIIMELEENPFTGSLEKTCNDSNTSTLGLGFVLDEEPVAVAHSQLMCFSTVPKLSEEEDIEENDFFDELEELPISSSFTSFMRSCHLSDELRIPVVPS